MTRIPLIPMAILLAGSAVASPPDVIRFTNGDQLHGSYQGIRTGQQLTWSRDDISEAALFNTDNLRHIILRGGNPAKPLASLSHVDLVNGDRIPGTISALDETTLTIDTSCAGTITLPRGMVAGMSPNPLGGRILYYGPFSGDGWEITYPADYQPDDKDGKADESGENDPDAEQQDAQPDPQDTEPAPAPEPWKQAGAAWYWKGTDIPTALIRRDSLPGTSILRFQLSWKTRPLIAIGINADFHTAPAGDKDEKQDHQGRFISSTYRSMPLTFGNATVLRIQSNYLSIYRTGIDEDGKPRCESVSSTNNRLPIENLNKADFEIRSNRGNGDMILFVNGQFITQWNHRTEQGDDNPDANPAGNGFGFLPLMDDSRLRVTEVVVSDWNGMPDSARSTSSDQHDVVLMSNGLDRIAGKATRITDDRKLVFNSRHGEFRIPLDEVAEVRLARNNREEAPSHPQDSLTVRFTPSGNISGIPVSGSRDTLTINHPVVGKLELSTESAVMLEFNATSSLINDWDADF